MSSRTRGTLVAYLAWTLFVWATRLSILWGSGSATGNRAVASLLVLSFLGCAGVVAAVLVRARGQEVPPGGAVLAIRLVAAWTVGVWVVRAVGIALDHHPVAFLLVHLVLAVVSITLALLSARRIAADRSSALVGADID